MEENKKSKKEADHSPDPVKSIVNEYRTEFRRIVWPSKPILFKHTVTVIAVSLLFGAYIALLDGIFSFGLRQFIGLVV
ncbi:MAG: preprotein translocase subunit SecE [Defluviitaleaceae bacterium]|nr:preprotein translocase subunit SecE [Defluviitaleaceae bacterium]MCL2238978.1 preprotein translocase subunit SecE [Defluviitaleaceae bacterium]